MRYVLINAHWNNRGDEAALRALIEEIYSLDHESRISIIFKETKKVSQFPYEGRIRYIATRFRPTEKQVRQAVIESVCPDVEMRREMAFIQDADLVIYAPGGAVISDRFWWEKQLEYIFPLAYAQSKSIPTFFAAPSIGPFSERHTFRNDVLKKVEALCLRESVGVTAFENEIGSGKLQEVILSNDLAFLGRIDLRKQRDILEQDKELCDFLNNYKKVVGITITDLSWNVEYCGKGSLVINIKEVFCQFICYLKEMEIGVVLIPQLFAEQNDREYLLQFRQGNTIVLSDNYDSEFQQYLISNLYAVVGLRYHSNIFAAKMGTPMLPIIYEQKMEGFLLDSGIYEWGIEINDLSFEVMKVKFKDLMNDYENRNQYLKNCSPDWTARSMRTIEALRRWKQKEIL